MKNKFNFIFILALAFAVAATWGTYKYLEHLKSTYKSTGEFVTVVVAKGKIASRTIIDQNLVELKEIPSQYANSSAIKSLQEVTGKATRGDIYPGEQILTSKIFSQKTGEDGLAWEIEPGRRATTLAVNEVSGVASMIKPGDRVDILATVDQKTGQDTVTFTSSIIQYVRVLAVNQSLGVSEDSKKIEKQTITLSLTPAEAQQMVLASERGSVRLTLRSPADNQIVPVNATTIIQLNR